MGALIRRLSGLRRRPMAAPQPAAVDGRDILEKAVTLPVSTWRYGWEPTAVRHLGPMAQDWHAAFGLGQGDTRIPLVDAHGVALVCIQALHREIAELRAEIEQLRSTTE